MRPATEPLDAPRPVGAEVKHAKPDFMMPLRDRGAVAPATAGWHGE